MNFINIVILNHYVNTLVFDKCWNIIRRTTTTGRYLVKNTVELDKTAIYLDHPSDYAYAKKGAGYHYW